MTTADGQVVPKTDDGRVKFDDWCLPINPNEHKLWAAAVTGYDEETKYNWIQTFLESEQRDGDKYYDVRGVSVGDYIRVAAGTRGSDFTSVLEVVGVDDDALYMKTMTDEGAKAAVSGTEDAERAAIMRDIGDVMQGMEMYRLRALHRHLDADGDGDGDE